MKFLNCFINFLTKNIRDNYRIYSLIIILNVGIVANVRCGFFKMSNVSHLTMFLPPNHIHFTVVRRIYKYVHETNHWGLCYQSGMGVNLFEAYVDSNFVIDFIDKKLKTCFMLKMNGGPISWGS
jgi:hypothetical protein